ncbi:MAG: MerR family transcriptional regulator [Clostridia bacterium]|nr:MerR family transcriptional regulator [Clostridia bacterium]
MEFKVKIFKIGEFCKNLGVSPDFLKYQEEHGIIRPWFKENSDYRYYNVEHAGMVYETLQYKNLGFSSREIKRLLDGKSSDEIMDMLAAKDSETEEQIARLSYHSDYIRSLIKHKRSEDRPNPWYVCDLGGLYYLPHFHMDDFISDERTKKMIREWIYWSPMVASTQRILCDLNSEHIRVDEKTDYYWGFLSREEFAAEVGLPTEAPVLYIPPRRCLLYYLNVVSPAPSSHQWREMLQAFFRGPVEATMKQCGFKASGDIYNVVLFYSYEGGARRIHTQMIIPLED